MWIFLSACVLLALLLLSLRLVFGAGGLVGGRGREDRRVASSGVEGIEGIDRGPTRRSFAIGVSAIAVFLGTYGRLGRVGAALRSAAPEVAVPPAAAAVPASARAPSLARLILPMNSWGANVLPGMSAEICARPQHHGFKPDRLVIAGADEWVVEGIRVGDSDFLSVGEVPGGMFSTSAVPGPFLSLPTVGVATDLAMRVRYVGKSPQGACFHAAFLGHEAA